MRRIAIALTLGLLLVAGCSEDPAGPSKAEFDEERAALMARLEKKKQEQRQDKDGPAVAKAQRKREAAPSGGFGAVDESFSYDASGVRDPFRSYEWERPDRQEEELRGPLERFEVAQLELVAVVWKTGNAKALVEDPAGQSYIIGFGTKIGKNQGRVTRIEDNLVVVKETYVDYLGQESQKDIEMRIRGNEGG